MGLRARAGRQQGVGVCEPGGEAGIFFPTGTAWEEDLEKPYKIALYGFALAWCFMGVSVISAIFMSAIDIITAKKKRIWDQEKQRHRTVKVWNETVANLTLMALGSSAPEIMLNVVEVYKNSFFAGSLGPGTIVGSAAFNLLIISAVCVLAIPDDDYRVINDTTVYITTAMFSLFAYLWLIFVLMLTSKDVVRLWEAVLTLSFFPLLLVVSFAADKGWITGIPAMANRCKVVAAEMTKEEISHLVEEIKEEFGDVNEQSLAVLIEKRTAARPTRAAIRAERHKRGSVQSFAASMTNSTANTPVAANTPGSHGGSDGFGFGSSKSSEKYSGSTKAINSTSTVVSGVMRRASTVIPPDQATIEWSTSNYAVLESAKFVVTEVRRDDNIRSKVSVRYRTKEGTATPGKDYIHVEGQLSFAAGEKVKKIPVKVLDDETWENAEDFYIELYDVICDEGSAILGPNRIATITIIDDDDPGALCFEKDFIVHESDTEGEVMIRVLRKHGCKGEVSCACRTEDDSAVAPLDYEPFDDNLTLKDGEINYEIRIPVTARGRYDSSERFRLILSEPVGCRFDSTADGDQAHINCTVELKASAEARAVVDKLVQQFATNCGKAALGKENWKEQFASALYVGGSQHEQSEAGIIDWLFHALILPWKLLFATVPPTDFGGGWWCFIVSLLYIGVVTAAIGDLAMLFGCVIGIPDQITAITLVALGTSLPDTFASRTAAIQDPYADASITNITGSNSVNVFLGLGLPWTVASLYWCFTGQTTEWRDRTPERIRSEYPDYAVYVLEADDLGFSVSVFTACALCAMGALWMRRKLFKGELGGPFLPKVASAIYLVLLWCIYVASSWIYIQTN